MATNSKEYNRKNYKKYWGSKSQIQKRSESNKARRKKGLQVGDKREVHHVKPLSKGGTNSSGNLKVISRKKNRQHGANLANAKKRAKKKR
jgi:5-methylcytosine-specific restriction endonuclease McrA